MSDPASSDPPAKAPRSRLVSIDALRGFDMVMILGVNEVAYALGRAYGDGLPGFLAYQFEHAEWAGFRFYDLIFPLFISLVGVSIVLSLDKYIAAGDRRAVYRRIFVRFALLYVLALIYYGGASRSWPDIRLMGVLNRIALCYLAASLLFLSLRWRGLAAVTVAILVGYWALMTFVPFPDVRPRDPAGELISSTLMATRTDQLNWSGTPELQGVFERGVNLASYVDQKYLPGRKSEGTWDSDGLLSTLPAIATCLLGVLAGLLLQNQSVGNRRKVIWLTTAGLAALTIGWLWHLQFPVIKDIWTSSYVLVSAGYSALLLAAFYQVIEIWKWQAWTAPFVWVGANAITLYLVNEFVSLGRLSQRLVGGDVRRTVERALGEGFGDLLTALTALCLVLAVARFLYQRKVFLRL